MEVESKGRKASATNRIKLFTANSLQLSAFASIPPVPELPPGDVGFVREHTFDRQKALCRKSVTMLSTSRAGWQRCALNTAWTSRAVQGITVSRYSKRMNATSRATKADEQGEVALADPESPTLPGGPIESKQRRTGSRPRDTSLSEALYSYRKDISASDRPNYTDWHRTAPWNLAPELPPDISPQARLKHNLRALLREVAQPVAVVTSFMPTKEARESTDESLLVDPKTVPEHHRFHGATLSSFSSIAMDPNPLVAFALRVPSRMATTLSSLVPDVPPLHSPQPSESMPSAFDEDPAHLVINILSLSQHSLAHAFSRPDLHPHPFESASYTLSEDGLPILNDSLGALSCKVVARVKLHEIGQPSGRRDATEAPHHVGQVASELFIAEVTKVEAVGVHTKGRRQPNENGQKFDPKNEPLIYWRRGYTHARPPKHRY